MLEDKETVSTNQDRQIPLELIERELAGTATLESVKSLLSHLDSKGISSAQLIDRLEPYLRVGGVSAATPIQSFDAPPISLLNPSAVKSRPRTPKPRIIEVRPDDAEKPESKQEPLPHQIKSESLLRRTRRCILADDMGLGKTLPAIEAAEGRTVVICPATLKSNWAREIGRQRPEEKIVILQGRAPEPIPEDALWAIANFEIAKDWGDTIVRWHPETAIIDEAHVLRSRKTKMFPACRKIAWTAKGIYLLTGTPIVNRPSDLISLINLLGYLGEAFGGWENYVKRYCNARQTPYGLDISGATNLIPLP